MKSENLLRYYLCRKEKILCSFYIWKVDSVHLQSISNASQYIMDCLSGTSQGIGMSIWLSLNIYILRINMFIIDSSLISSDIDIGPVFSKLGRYISYFTLHYSYCLLKEDSL